MAITFLTAWLACQPLHKTAADMRHPIPGDWTEAPENTAWKGVQYSVPSANYAPRPDNGVHTVAKGDTLSGIASKYGMSPTRLAALNPTLDPRKLQIGQQVSISIPDREYIRRRFGFDPEDVQIPTEYIRALQKYKESTSGTNMVNPTTNALGPYQVKETTFREAQRLNPALAGYSHKDVLTDPQLAEDVQTTLYKDWGRKFQYRYGRRPTDHDYLAGHYKPNDAWAPDAQQYADSVLANGSPQLDAVEDKKHPYY